MYSYVNASCGNQHLPLPWPSSSYPRTFLLLFTVTAYKSTVCPSFIQSGISRDKSTHNLCPRAPIKLRGCHLCAHTHPGQIFIPHIYAVRPLSESSWNLVSWLRPVSNWQCHSWHRTANSIWMASDLPSMLLQRPETSGSKFKEKRRSLLSLCCQEWETLIFHGSDIMPARSHRAVCSNLVSTLVCHADSDRATAEGRKMPQEWIIFLCGAMPPHKLGSQIHPSSGHTRFADLMIDH